MSEPPALRSTYLKLRRGEEHLRTLEEFVEGFFEDHAVAVESELDTDSGEKVWRVKWDPPQPPGEWSILLGEMLYNSRSALDHLAQQLVIVSGRKPTSKTEFPIFKDPRKYLKYGPKKTKGMRPEYVALIDRRQPCHGRDTGGIHRPWEVHPLWWLQDLCNTDKHRELHLFTAGVQGGTFSRGVRMTNSEFGERFHTGRVEAGTELLRLPPEYVDMEYVPHFGVEVEIPNPPSFNRRDVGYLGKAITNRVRMIVNDFARFFPW